MPASYFSASTRPRAQITLICPPSLGAGIADLCLSHSLWPRPMAKPSQAQAFFLWRVSNKFAGIYTNLHSPPNQFPSPRFPQTCSRRHSPRGRELSATGHTPLPGWAVAEFNKLFLALSFELSSVSPLLSGTILSTHLCELLGRGCRWPCPFNPNFLEGHCPSCTHDS